MPKRDRERQELGQTLMLMARDFHHRLSTDLKARGVAGISARHNAVFLYLGRHGASRAVDLAAAAGVRPQSMMKIVDELETLGLIERRPDPADSRAKLIHFTGRGETLIAELSRSTTTVWNDYAAILGKKTLRETLDNLNRLLQAQESSHE